MAISPVLLNGSIQQTDNILQNQTRMMEKGVVDQGNIHVQEVKKEQEKARTVIQSEESKLMEERFDAKEKGHNGYYGDGGRRRKGAKSDGKVVNKSEGGFDMKI